MINLYVPHSAYCEITLNLYPPVEYDSDTFYFLNFTDRTIDTAKELFNILNVDAVFCHEHRFILFWFRDEESVITTIDEHLKKNRIIKDTLSALYNSFVEENHFFPVNYCSFEYATYEEIKKSLTKIVEVIDV